MDVVHVAAAAIFGRDGRLLVSRRQAHQHQGGFWEFPGGKCEPGEPIESALCRELEEELGIRPTRFSPLITIPFDYPDKRVLLDVWRVDGFDGEPFGREGQPLRWVVPAELSPGDFPPANRPVISALQLTDRYLITGEFQTPDELITRCQRALAQGVGMIQLRMPGRSDDDSLAAQEALYPLCQRMGVPLIVNGDPERVSPQLADGIHLNRHRLAGVTPASVQPWRQRWIGASCHDQGELRRAVEIGAAYVTLSPVLPTLSHPEQPAMGWQAFAELCRQAPLPVYALGGVSDSQLEDARRHGAQGVAAIRAYWDR
ncbi:Nudix family hydrolase [Motiliproteus sediminis]|uniref:Nudix family hydrolase n=1 Tax=Motiliproteus sediminis TaxID=1468178 RepID=UPI001AEF4043|nr:Nudix family hydrolase [Motiliproteus sediminis]